MFTPKQLTCEKGFADSRESSKSILKSTCLPAELFVLEIRRPKRACGKCKDGVAQVPAGEEPGGPTTPVPGSDYGFGVYTQIMAGKFADHLPLYRGEDTFARAL